ncbi:hypothetical protein KGF56_002163 [Candida oxycetoniae]|uniref:[acyl-carrier-protein] S-malonyltransferase n=1 Tax=Candida oxycetoniae TaxID=497107 RepID=A0AAI9WYC6_9ASCO|nr:uncharacterized protein KGF56_002163 [Candida oxycetoniae]KAI3404998.2 hypothetical protein KGF56_002163 [Candida oxycetoniae]
MSKLKLAQRYAITCPGQGILRPGLINPNKQYLNLYSNLLEEVDSVLGFNFSKYLFSDNEANNSISLLDTRNAQPAILATTYITLKTYEKVNNVPLLAGAKYLLGHSLGEYTALTLSGVIDFPTAIQLVRLRGELMEDIVFRENGCNGCNKNNKNKYGMVALLVRPSFVDDVIALATKYQVLANINSKTQIVISGVLTRLDEFVEKLKREHSRSVLKTVKLPVSIPFHNEILKQIVPELASFLDGKLHKQNIPIVTNLDGEISSDAKTTVQKTLKANYLPVQWIKSMNFLLDAELDVVYNLGPGDITHNINKKYNIKNILIDKVEKVSEKP